MKHILAATQLVVDFVGLGEEGIEAAKASGKSEPSGP